MNLLQMSLSASVLIVFTMVFRHFCADIVPKSVFSLLWKIVWCKLMIPFSIHLPNWREVNAKPLTDTPVAPTYFNVPMEMYRISGNAAGFFPDWKKTIWIAGIVCLGFYFIYTYIHSIRKFRLSLPVEDSFINQWLAKKRLFRRVEVRRSAQIDSPLTYGIILPVILLPQKTNWVGRQNLVFVLEHEMAHIKRWDSLWKLLIALSMTIHWFNPLVWGMYQLANRDMEMACDEKVIRTIGRSQRTLYANILVEWGTKKTGSGRLLPHLKQNFLKERIINIMKMKKQISALGIILSMALVTGSAVVYAATPTSIHAIAGQQADDMTLGGLFELYTPEEFEEVVNNVKKYADASSSDVKEMEENLKKLKDDNGEGNFVIYKSAFEVQTEKFVVSFNPIIVMRPDLVTRDTPLTAESYQKDIEEVRGILERAVNDGNITSIQRESILNKMYDNLENMN